MPRPLPVLTSPLRIPSANRNLLVRWTHQRSRNVLVPVTTVALKRPLDPVLRAKSIKLLRSVTRSAGDFSRRLPPPRASPRFPFAIQPVRPGWRKRVKYAFSGMSQQCPNLRGDYPTLRSSHLQRGPVHLGAPKRTVPKRPTRGPSYQLYLTFNPFGFYLQNA